MNRTIAFYRENLVNWPAICLSRATGLPFYVLKLRSGHALRLLDPQAEIWAFRSIWQERCYDRDFDDIPRNGTVIDLGANVGIFTLYARIKLVSQGAVLAVEPNPDCETLLRQNCATLDNVAVLGASVGGDGHLHLANDSLGASVFRSDEAVRTVPCPVISPEDVLTRFPQVDLLKINMEGAEYPFVLDTSAELWQAVQRVAVKWHDETEIAQNHRPVELRDRLHALGFGILRHEVIWRRPGLTTGITTARRTPSPHLTARGASGGFSTRPAP